LEVSAAWRQWLDLDVTPKVWEDVLHASYAAITNEPHSTLEKEEAIQGLDPFASYLTSTQHPEHPEASDDISPLKQHIDESRDGRSRGTDASIVGDWSNSRIESSLLLDGVDEELVAIYERGGARWRCCESRL